MVTWFQAAALGLPNTAPTLKSRTAFPPGCYTQGRSQGLRFNWLGTQSDEDHRRQIICKTSTR